LFYIVFVVNLNYLGFRFCRHCPSRRCNDW